MKSLSKALHGMGGHTTIRSMYGYVEFSKYGKFVFSTKDVNLFDLIIQPWAFVPNIQIRDARPIQLFGVPCTDNHENHTIAIVEDDLTGELFGVPMFTESALRFSKVVREYGFRICAHHFATLLPKTCTELPETRYVKFTRMGTDMQGFTGIFEAIGDFPDWSFHPCSYCFDRDAEILKLEIEAIGADLLFEDREKYTQEYNVSSEAYQHILDSCIFLNPATYAKKKK